jgi:hypothetical protein
MADFFVRLDDILGKYGIKDKPSQVYLNLKLYCYYSEILLELSFHMLIRRSAFFSYAS